MVLLADQHGKRSCLAGASTCFWTQCTEYLQQVTQSAVSAGTSYRQLYFSTVLGKHFCARLRNVTFQLSLLYQFHHSFNNGSYQRNLYVLVLTPQKSHTSFFCFVYLLLLMMTITAIRCMDGTWSGSTKFLFR